MSFFVRYCVFGAVLVLVHIVTCIVGYHFDVDNVILYEDVPINEEFRESYFGYSVAISNTSSLNPSIFIGAPRANSTSYKNEVEPGTVFKCEIGKPCKEWVIHPIKRPIPEKGSWLGGSIAIEKKKNKDMVLVCAPRWVDTYQARWTMNGMCYQAKASDCSSLKCANEKSLRPLQSAPELLNKRTLYFAYGLAGFSTAIIPKNFPYIQYVFGCPGAYLGHGTPIRSNFGIDKNSFIIPNPTKDESVTDSAYSGYAVTTGIYFGASKRVYATGAPRGADLRGKVILFDFPEINGAQNGMGEGIKQINIIMEGDQIGEYFGAALASCDIDGDGSDDLLVGAPHRSKNMDEGRIYIFRGNTRNSRSFKGAQIIDGEMVQGRFGSAITCLGDIDYDGYADVAVGAPYAGNGAVYIYHGSKDGLNRTQKISAPEYTKGFGISISEPKDIDNNGYGDIAVGAYLSGHVALFRSKRVVNMAVTLSSNLLGGRLERDADSFVVTVCSSYTGRYPPQELNVTKRLEINDIYQRAEIDIGNKRLRTYEFNDTITMESNPSCQNFTITIKKTTQEFLESVKLSVTQRLNANNKNGTLLVKRNTTGTEYFNVISAVTNEAHQEVRCPLDIRFALDCGNTTCNSNLSIHMTTNLLNVSHYVIGSVPYIKLNIEVTNTGDQAYHTQVDVSIPMFIRLHSKPPSCTTAEMDNTITCDLANPLDRNKTKSVSLGLDLSNMPRDTKQFHLNATAKTESSDAASGNHETSLSIDCVMETDIGITGKADINTYTYTLEEEKEQSQSIMYQHTYVIKNYEVTPITKALFSVSIPTHWVHESNEIEVVKVNKITGILDDREFHCTDTGENMEIAELSYDAFTMSERLNGDNSSLEFESQTKKKYPIDNGKIIDVPLDNRTLYINCTNTSFKCKTISCELGSFESAQSMAKLVLKLDLLLPNFTPKMIKKKDIIFFVSNASASITQTVNNRPDSMLIGTRFIRSPSEDRLPPWLIPLSVFIGVLLLIVAILGLFKCGFFKRSEKIKLQELLKDTDMMGPNVFIATTSSTEALDTT